MRSVNKIVLAIMIGAKILLTGIVAIFSEALFGTILFDLSFVSPWYVMAIAFSAPPKWLMLLILSAIGAFLLGLIVFLVLLLMNRSKGRLFPIVVQLFFLAESIFLILMSLGLWKILGIIFNLVIIIMLQTMKEKHSN